MPAGPSADAACGRMFELAVFMTAQTPERSGLPSPVRGIAGRAAAGPACCAAAASATAEDKTAAAAATTTSSVRIFIAAGTYIYLPARGLKPYALIY